MDIRQERALQRLVEKVQEHGQFDLVIRTLVSAGHCASELARLAGLKGIYFDWVHYAYISDMTDESSRNRVYAYLCGEICAVYGVNRDCAEGLVEVAHNELFSSKRTTSFDRASILRVSRKTYYKHRALYDAAIDYSYHSMLALELRAWRHINPMLDGG